MERSFDVELIDTPLKLNGTQHRFIIDDSKCDLSKTFVPGNHIWGADNLPHNLVIEILAERQITGVKYTSVV